MDVERAGALLAAEWLEIERALQRLAHEDDGDDAGWLEPGNLAADLYLDELDDGLAEVLRDRIAAIERAEQRLAAGTYGLSIESGKPIPESVSRPCRPPSGRWRRSAPWSRVAAADRGQNGCHWIG